METLCSRSNYVRLIMTKYLNFINTVLCHKHCVCAPHIWINLSANIAEFLFLFLFIFFCTRSFFCPAAWAIKSKSPQIVSRFQLECVCTISCSKWLRFRIVSFAFIILVNFFSVGVLCSLILLSICINVNDKWKKLRIASGNLLYWILVSRPWASACSWVCVFVCVTFSIIYR